MKIMNVTEENLDDFIKLCIPPGREKDELFFRGGEEKRLEPRPSALVTWAFRVPETFSQDEFFRRMGFREVEGGDTMLLYYPLQEGFVYRPERKEYIP